ncbi:LemA family protein [Reinekea forsetii]|nr:LemA family protein [Reinekea forsetii]
MVRRIAYFCIALCLMGLALLGFTVGFSKLADVRQLDRLPVSPLSALTKGEYLVSGTITNKATSIIAPYSDDAVVYYHYVLTETYTDSDGNQQTRTLESGKSATPFFIQDNTAQVQVDPGFRLSDIRFIAPQTYQYKKGDLTYTEQTLRTGDAIQLTGTYGSENQTLELQSNMTLPKFVTNDALNESTGQSLLGISLILSASAGALAIGFALLLSSFAVHRFWVFVVSMTLGLMGAFSYLGLHWVQIDWQSAEQLYSLRSEGVLHQPNNKSAEQDLYQYFVRIEQSAQGWPDSALFSSFFDTKTQPNVWSQQEQQQLQEAALVRDFSRLKPVWLGSLLAIVGAIICLVFIGSALKAIRFKRLVEFIPTSKTTGLSYGLAELNGQAKTHTHALTSPLNQQECFAYEYCIEQKQGTGKNQKWVEIESGAERVSFSLKDELGRVRVNPNEANIEYSDQKVEQKGSRRYTEKWLATGAQLYCLGFARIDTETAGQLILAEDPNKEMKFLISAKTEQQVILGKGVNGFLLTGFALMFGIVAATMWLTLQSNFSPLDLLKVSLVVPAILLGITVIMHYNGLVFLRQRIHKTAADIDTLLQKRADLFPRLAEIVSAYLSHESDVMKQLVNARSQVTPVGESVVEAETQLKTQNAAKHSLLALVEQYPDLKANKPIELIMQQMSEAEDELALIRQGYNDAVMLYNNQIEKLPDVFLAKLFAFKPSAPFQMS